MLQSWVSVQDRVSKAPPPSDARGETAEHREARLRTLYERALSRHQVSLTSAIDQFQALADELRLPSSTHPADPDHPPPAKRPRTDVPLWQRRLRYAALRNLAEGHFAADAPRPALAAYAAALDIDPSDFLVWVHAARAAAAAGYLHVARRAYESALVLRPHHHLAVAPLRALLAAVPDPDDDVRAADAQNPAILQEAIELANARAKALKEEKDANRPEPPEQVHLPEASWFKLVDVLIAILNTRLRGHGPLVAHPIHLVLPPPPQPPQQQPASSEAHDLTNDSSDVEEVLVVSESRAPAKRPREWEAGKNPAKQAQPDPAAQAAKPGAPAPAAPRRSSRRAEAAAAAAADNERRRTRTFTDATDGKAADATLVQTLLRMSALGTEESRADAVGANGEKENVSDGMGEDKEAGTGAGISCTTGVTASADGAAESGETRRTSWRRVINERDEATTVRRCVESLNKVNSGPADLLLRTLSSLSEVRVVQYFPTLAKLWTTVRDKLQLHVPGSRETTALVVEAMIVSGKKAAKQKARRFQEAARLLAQIRLPSAPGCDDDTLLRMRLTWSSSLLHECRTEMQLSYEAAERTRDLLRSMNKSSTDFIPDLAGPELSGQTVQSLETLVTARIARLKSAGDLEKAEEELSKVGAGDMKAAQRTVSILAPSVHSSVTSLELDKWHANDLKFEFNDDAELQEWESRYEATLDLEPRVVVLHEACTKSSDCVGELYCYSIRLRMAIYYYVAKVRAEAGETQHRESDTSASRMADLLIQIRRYVFLIRKIMGPNLSSLWTSKPGVTGWSMADAAAIACLTVVSLTELVITTIPLLKFTNGDIEMGPAQKNKRLGFTRCMLAFPRCVLLLHKCRKASADETTGPAQECGLNKKMLQVISFTLRALAARGCCREEGTSGALIKFYVKHLTSRLQEIAKLKHAEALAKKKANEEKGAKDLTNTKDISNANPNANPNAEREEIKNSSSSEGSEDGSSDSEVQQDDPEYEWKDVRVLRYELAQCFQCLNQLHNLEPGYAALQDDNVAWLEEGCKVSRHIGLSFVASEPPSKETVMDLEVCRNVYFFYRKRIFEATCFRRRGSGKVKRIREVLARLSESLPEDPGGGVRLLPFLPLDNIMSDVVGSYGDIYQTAEENVARLEEEWNRLVPSGDVSQEPIHTVRGTQNSIMYFEVSVLNATTALSLHELDYKKQKSAERRKRPKDVADRILMASCECLMALRSRPWSVGVWILLGRIFLEIADLALDERELCLSSFGIHRPEDLATLGEGETIQTIIGRAEACFAFAGSLLKHPWTRTMCSARFPLSAPYVFGLACDDGDTQPWYGFGDDGDLFEMFGLTNKTTSRPRLLHEAHPGSTFYDTDTRRKGSIRLGESAVLFLRLREQRYFHVHWAMCSLESKMLVHPRNRYDQSLVDLAETTLQRLKEGVELCEVFSAEDGKEVVQIDEEESDVFPVSSLGWRSPFNSIAKSQWYYAYLEAKLLRKCGCDHEEYLEALNKARELNMAYRERSKQARDIEPLYKLHVSRMKVLRTTEDNAESISTLKLLGKYAFKSQPNLVIMDEWDDDIDEKVADNRRIIAEDIISAMQACADPRSDAQYSEFFFKGIYCKAILLAEVLREPRAALEELDKVFRMDAATRALDQRNESTHRGYFYKLWNYRFTDTGIEPSLETERKLVRWRGKLLGLYGQLLKQFGEWRLLAAIIYRLKKRSADDLPVDGAILDDLIEGYAVTCRASIISTLEKSIVTDVSAFESSFQRTWEIYIETIRLSQGAKKVRFSVAKGENFGTGEDRLIQSGRPRCLMAIHTALYLEHIRWKSARDGFAVDMDVARQLPTSGDVRELSNETRQMLVKTMNESARKWPLDDKMNKFFMKRVQSYSDVVVTQIPVEDLDDNDGIIDVEQQDILYPQGSPQSAFTS